MTKFEIPSFPVRIPPTLLRFATDSRGDADSQPFRLALLFTREAKSDAAAELATNSSAGYSEDPTDASSSFVLFVQVFATERQYREQRKVLLRLFTGDQHAYTANTSTRSGSVLAVNKHASDASCKSNATFLLKSNEDVEVAIDRLWNGTLVPDSHQQENGGNDGFSHSCAIQKYVSVKGSTTGTSTISRKAWIARPVYRKKARASWIWILTDSANSEMTDSASHDSCQLVKCTAPQSWASPRLIASTCSHFFENLLRVSITELTLDLIQDSDGKWWLLQVKAFQVRRQHHRPSSAAASTGDLGNEIRVKSAPNRLEGSGSLTQQHKKWRCAGRYCNDDGEAQNNQESSMASSAPSGYLTKKVLLSCDFYEKYMTQSDMSVTSGFASFRAALSFHLQHQVSKRDRNQLYESQPLCSACVTKYHFIREQWIDATTTSTTATLSATKTVRKKTQHGGMASPLANAPPRLLPSLQSTSASALSSNSNSSTLLALPVMKASHSAPVIQRTNFQQSTSDQHNQQVNSTPERPEYLSEMDKIEEMLTAHDAKFASTQSSKKKCEQQHESANPSPVGEYEEEDQEANQFSRFLQKRSEADSVEEMWKSISFPKPIPASSSVHSTSTAAGVHERPPVQYNSYSLARELEKQQQQANTDTKPPPKSQPLLVNRLESHGGVPVSSLSGARSSPPATSPVHTIAISSCKQVFYDEAYRERVVNEAKELLFHRSQSVRLVIVPSSIPQQVQPFGEEESSIGAQQQQSHQDDDDQELAEMALRTLFLDLSQSAATARMAASLRKMPAIARESSGCTTMLLTPST